MSSKTSCHLFATGLKNRTKRVLGLRKKEKDADTRWGPLCDTAGFVGLSMWTYGCLFTNSYNFYTRCFMIRIAFSIVMLMPHVAKRFFLFAFALFRLQRLTIQRWRGKRKERKRTYTFRFSSKVFTALWTLSTCFFCLIWLVPVTFIMLRFFWKAENITTASQSDGQMQYKQQKPFCFKGQVCRIWDLK